MKKDWFNVTDDIVIRNDGICDFCFEEGMFEEQPCLTIYFYSIEDEDWQECSICFKHLEEFKRQFEQLGL